MDYSKMTFDFVATQFEPMIKKQIKALHLYKSYDEFYQMGLIALWEAHKNFDSKKGAFPAYAQSYVRGKMMTLLQKEKTFETRHEIHDDDVQITKSYTMFDDEREELPDLYFEGLSPREKLWVHEAIVLQKKRKQIAEDHRVSIEVVKGWRKGAIRKLRNKHLLTEKC
ncbi:sigma-70 family RNA polymerase sigma factor [Alkalihalobacillus sp. LMS39]|uniref:sigma-70 family RNA polymerase sigma factor n=1 Tax=Alkalihalobacillus sp. LMS39 TaxID=2924032 RepID=UPI001FB1A4F0|nr:sigma-70 family RNA polymerase sigma factor [Alkalihalobacillus sp. LMS39]UOE93883.1 sigma-70 family RNA polymerase sigma factor [Alkalihalobacillus sp. LMS39]